MVIADFQKVKTGEETYVPVSILMVIDRSPSMLEEVNGRKTGKPFKRAKEAALEFISKMSPKDKIKVVAFDYEVFPLGDYTEDKNYYKDKLKKLKVGRGTGLYNALKYAANDLKNVAGEKTVLFLTDGKNDVRKASDKVKAVTLDEALKIAVDNTIPIYSIGFGGADKKIMNKIAKETHSLYFKAASSKKLRELYLKIHSIIENQYIITYKSLADRKGKVNVSLSMKEDEREYALTDDEKQKAVDYKKDIFLTKEKEKIELKEKEISNVKRGLEKEKIEIETKKKELEKKENEIKAEKEKLVKMRSETEVKEKEVKELEKSLKTKEAELITEKQKLDNRKIKIESEEKDIETEKAAIAKSKTEIAKKEAEIATMKKAIDTEQKNLEIKKKKIIQIEKNIRNTNKDIMDYLQKKMKYIESEKKKLDDINDQAEESEK